MFLFLQSITVNQLMNHLDDVFGLARPFAAIG